MENVSLRQVLGDIVDKAKILEVEHPKGKIIFFVFDRDKRQFISRKLKDIKLDGILSIYTVFNNKANSVYGRNPVFMKTEFYKYILKYPYLDVYTKKNKFYKELEYLVYKTKTKNAIVLGTDSGIIPIVISKKINRIYAIDDTYKELEYAKQNIVENNANNVLALYGERTETLEKIHNGEYSAPGKKININLIISDTRLNDIELKQIVDFASTEILLYGKRELVNKLNQFVLELSNDYILDKEIFVEETFISRLRKKDVTKGEI